MRLYHDEDTKPVLLDQKAVAFIGYDDLARARALRLRENGLDVIVGSHAGDKNAACAKADRFAVHPIGTAVSLADLVAVHLPDESVGQVYAADIAPRLRQKAVLVFASGYAVISGIIMLPFAIDAVLLTPASAGMPVHIGVARDYSGQALAYALALAHATGEAQAGVVEVAFCQQTSDSPISQISGGTL